MSVTTCINIGSYIFRCVRECKRDREIGKEDGEYRCKVAEANFTIMTYVGDKKILFYVVSSSFSLYTSAHTFKHQAGLWTCNKPNVIVVIVWCLVPPRIIARYL